MKESNDKIRRPGDYDKAPHGIKKLSDGLLDGLVTMTKFNINDLPHAAALAESIMRAVPSITTWCQSGGQANTWKTSPPRSTRKHSM